MVVLMKKLCEICDKEFETESKSRLYCYDCIGYNYK